MVIAPPTQVEILTRLLDRARQRIHQEDGSRADERRDRWIFPGDIRPG